MMGLRRAAVLVALGVTGGVLGIGVLGVWLLPVVFSGRMLPGVSVAGIPMGGRTHAEAQSLLSERASRPVTLRFVQDPDVFGLAGAGGMQVAEADPRELGSQPDLAVTLAAAYAVGRSSGAGAFLERLALFRGTSLPIQWTVDPVALEAYLRRVFPQGFIESQEASWELTGTGTFVYQPSKPGSRVVLDLVAADIADRLGRGSGKPVRLAVSPVPPPAPTIAGAETARVLQAPLMLVAEEDGKSISVPVSVRVGWVARPKAPQDAPKLDEREIATYVRSIVVKELSTPAAEAHFAVDGTYAIFTPPQAGTEVLVPETVAGIAQGLAAGANKIKVVTTAVRPSVTVTPLMAQYGIRALVARGESDFAGSPKNRIHNIRVGASKYHGLLIPPGVEFSFNAHLGPVDAANGFLRELVILSNVTTPQYGGGLCQVSTTMFRAAVYAGVPITARRNHAYAVSYYGTPGFDATIYPPNPDVRFRNDTPGHLLIQMRQEGTKLAFEFWGTPDGRQVEVLGPFPFDRKSGGALKARLVRKITKAGDTQREEWLSNYKSPKLFPKVLAANAETETWEQRARRIAEKDRRAREEFERRKVELLRRQQETRNQERGTSRPTPTPTPTPEE